MCNINQFAISGVWDYKNVIVPMAVGIPLAVEGAFLAKNIYQNPQFLKENAIHLKDTLIKSFTPQKEEERFAAISRISKNIFFFLSCLGFMAVAAYFTISLLPSSVGITTAISLIFLIGKIFANAGKYKNLLIDSFTTRKGESEEEARKRILKNVLRAALAVLASAAAIYIGTFILTPFISHGFSWTVSLPFQTKGVVFAEYASLGLLHVGIAAHKWKKGNKKDVLFHIFCAALSLIFPGFYWNSGEMRLHHSFYGLALMAAPSRPLQFLGGIVTLDSALYFIEPWRGYISLDRWGWPHKNEYDFINTIVDQYPLYAGSYAAALITENVNAGWGNNRFPSRNEPQKESDSQPCWPKQSPELINP